MKRRIKIYSLDTLYEDPSLATIDVHIKDWMDKVDEDTVATEQAVIWCSDNGYSYDDIDWIWE